MKAASWILKIAAAILAAAAVVCCVLANLDRITDWFLTLREQIAAKRSACTCPSDVDEYEEWDI